MDSDWNRPRTDYVCMYALDGKKFVDIKVFLQLARSSMKTCFKLVFAKTRSKHVLFCNIEITKNDTAPLSRVCAVHTVHTVHCAGYE